MSGLRGLFHFGIDWEGLSDKMTPQQTQAEIKKQFMGLSGGELFQTEKGARVNVLRQGMPGMFQERQEGQVSWSEVGKGVGRREDVREVAGGGVCRAWQPPVRTLTFTLREMGAIGRF